MAINKRKILESAQKHLQRGALDKALEDYRSLLKADPHDSNVLLKVGDLYLKQGKRDEAINSYLRVAQQFTRDGFDAKAVALYKQITRLDPKRHDVSVPLADLYARMGLVPDAIAALQTAADAAYRAGEKDGALELLRRMAALDPANTQNRLKVAELFVTEKRVPEAVAEYQAVADELERRGEDEERIKVLERMLAADPERTPALIAVARARLAAHQYAGARKLAEQLIASQPDDLDGREILGHALLGEGDEDRSRETFRELAELFRLRGDEGRARDLMQRFGGLEALAPDDSDATLDATDVPVLELEAAEPEDDFLLDPVPLDVPERTAERPSPPRAQTAHVEPPRAERERAPKPRLEMIQPEAPPPPPRPVPVAPVAPPPPPPAPVVSAVAAPPDLSELEAADPDQLLAEATVYLRYGKNERAVNALRSILAKEPSHRAALESLGEALAATGESAHALTAWQRAAEVARDAGDRAAVERIRERIAALDPEAAEAFAAPEPEPAPTAAAVDDEADIDIDIDIDVDMSGSFEVEPDSTGTATSDLDSLAIDLDGLDPLAGDELAQPEPAPAGLSLTPDLPTATTPARVAEDLEEAEFYFEQGLLDEARAFYERILAAAPNHPQAMLRLGEVAARSGAPAKAAPGVAAAPVVVAPAPARAAERVEIAAERIEVAAPAPDPAAELEIDFGIDLGELDDATPQPVEIAAPREPAPPPAPVFEAPPAPRRKPSSRSSTPSRPASSASSAKETTRPATTSASPTRRWACWRTPSPPSSSRWPFPRAACRAST